MRSDDSGKPLVLLIRSGGRDMREYLLKSMARRYRVHLFTGVQPRWELDYLSGYTIVDTREPADTLAAACLLHDQDPISGVLTWDEARVIHAAHVAAGLGLPGAGPTAALNCRDKNLTRQQLAARSVPQPRSVQVHSLAQARTAAEDIGYPVILKPSDLLLSMGVVRVDRPADLEAGFAIATDVEVPGRPDYVSRPLVEEFVTGYEISVDSAVQRGEVTVLCVARKQTGHPPYCIEVGHVVDARDPLLADVELARVVREAHAALGFQDGITHTEIMMTASGPKVIEVNGRLGGDLIAYLGQLATGLDMGLISSDVACGRAIEWAPDRDRVAAVRFFWVDEDDTRIESLGFDPAALPGNLDKAFLIASPGMVRSRPRGTYDGRIAGATATGESVQECQAALDAAAAALRVTKAPATADR